MKTNTGEETMTFFQSQIAESRLQLQPLQR